MMTNFQQEKARKPSVIPKTTRRLKQSRGLTKRAVEKATPFKTGALRNLADAERLTFDRLDRHNHWSLRNTLGNIPPAEHEDYYVAEKTAR
jgi:hypothetical protein